MKKKGGVKEEKVVEGARTKSQLHKNMQNWRYKHVGTGYFTQKYKVMTEDFAKIIKKLQLLSHNSLIMRNDKKNIETCTTAGTC